MSFEDQIASDVKLDGGDHTGDELQEDQQCEMRLDLLSILSHGVRHGLQDVSVLAGMDGRHQPAFDEIELFYGQRGIQVLLLNVFSNLFIGEGLQLGIGSAEEHPWGVVVFIVHDVHGVEAEVFLFSFLLLQFRRVEDDHLLAVISNYLLFLAGGPAIYSSLAGDLVEHQVLLVIVKIFGLVLRVGGGHPPPP